MKKSLIVLNISALFFTSCASVQNDYAHIERLPAATLSCNEMVKTILKKKKSANDDAQTFKSKVGLDITPGELNSFFKQFSAADLTTENSDTIKSIFLFSRDDSAIKKTLLDEFQAQLKGSAPDETNKTWTNFISHKKKVDLQKKKFAIKEKAEIYEKLYYNCKTQVKSSATPFDTRGAKRLSYALTVGGMGSTIATYSTVHWAEEKNNKWFNELYFSLGMGMVLSFIGSKFVVANPKLNPWTGKMPLAFLYNATTDAAVSGIYGQIFGPSDAELTKKLQDLEADPKAQEKLQELLKIAQEKKLFEKHLKNTQDLFKDKQTNKKMNASDFDHEITFADIDLEESRDLFIAALTEKEYSEKSGIIQTGAKSTDRYTYHRLYNLISTPTNIGISIFMYNQMCMSENPKQGFAKAVGIYMGASILMDSLYFEGRKNLINQ